MLCIGLALYNTPNLCTQWQESPKLSRKIAILMRFIIPQKQIKEASNTTKGVFFFFTKHEEPKTTDIFNQNFDLWQ